MAGRLGFHVDNHIPHGAEMTRHDPDRTSINAALELLVNEGFDGISSESVGSRTWARSSPVEHEEGHGQSPNPSAHEACFVNTIPRTRAGARRKSRISKSMT